MANTEELYISESGEAIIGKLKGNDSPFMNNPFMQLSNDLIGNWSPSITTNAAKTWKSTLTSSIDSTQKQDIFLQDFLNAILPPILTKITRNDDKENKIIKEKEKEEEEEEDLVYSLVSTQQTKRSELIEMQNEFDKLIKQRRAREVGLDNIRYQLAFQLFDEIIRQTAIDCKERGLLLLRIRDEAKVTLQAYGILKQVASTFSINEAEKSNQGFDDLIQTKTELLTKKQNLENQLLKLQNEMRDQQKEVEVLANVQSQQLEQHKQALENEATHLRLLIDSKKRRGSTRSRRKSLAQSVRNKSTRRSSIKDGSLAFSFNKSPPLSPTNI